VSEQLDITKRQYDTNNWQSCVAIDMTGLIYKAYDNNRYVVDV